jgi:hypothetical protein
MFSGCGTLETEQIVDLSATTVHERRCVGASFRMGLQQLLHCRCLAIGRSVCTKSCVDPDVHYIGVQISTLLTKHDTITVTWVQRGQLVMATVRTLSGACAVFQLADGSMATASLTSLHDTFVPNALQGITVGAFVRASVVNGQRDGKGRLQLSLQQRDGASHLGMSPVLPLPCCCGSVPVIVGELQGGFI